jgi:hypothetical protein
MVNHGRVSWSGFQRADDADAEQLGSRSEDASPARHPARAGRTGTGAPRLRRPDTDMFTGAHPPRAVIRDFWAGLYAALGD